MTDSVPPVSPHSGDTDCHGRDCNRDDCSTCRAMRAQYSRLNLAGDPGEMLRLAASGRRDYAATGGPNAELLSHEAYAFEMAALIVEGDTTRLYDLLPSWRWDEIPGPPTREATP